MASAPRIRLAALRVPLLLVLLAVASALAAALYTPAAAQDQGWSLRNLLSPRKSGRVSPPAPQLEQPRQKKKERSATPAQPAAPPAPVVEKAPGARTVLVVGDFMAGGLAEGLDEMFAENPGIRVVDRSKGSSGFVRDDFYDWRKEIGPLLQSEKPAAVVVMIGSNDRQQMRVGDGREPPRSEGWTREYEARAAAFAKTVAAARTPLLWVGVPAFKAGRMTADMLAFNGVYKEAAEGSGGEFVDIWDGFVDENGAFVSTGPDVSGQPVRLRADDGINLTRAGKRKVAFYVEKPLLKLLGLASPAGVAPEPLPSGLPSTGPSSTVPDGVEAPAVADRTQPMLLDDPALDGGSELLGAPSDGAPAEGLLVQGAAPRAGRADDFSWPAPAGPAADATGATTP